MEGMLYLPLTLPSHLSFLLFPPESSDTLLPLLSSRSIILSMSLTASGICSPGMLWRVERHAGKNYIFFLHMHMYHLSRTVCYLLYSNFMCERVCEYLNINFILLCMVVHKTNYPEC